jgi:hypothetical protein
MLSEQLLARAAASHSIRHHAAAIFLVVAAGLGVAACSTASTPQGVGSPSRAVLSSTMSPAASSQTADPSPDVRDTAVQVYLAMWADWVEAAKTADYQSPKLTDHAASQALQLISMGLQRAHQRNVVVKGQPTFSPRVVKVTPQTTPVAVTIQGCADDSNWLNYTADGQLADNTPGGKHRIDATVGLLSGQWIVTHLQVGQVGTCT